MARRVRKTIFVICSFMVKDGEWVETGKRFWFSTIERAVEYMENCGRPIPGGGCWDEPFEMRWGYAVIEEVPEGRYGDIKVHSWWKAQFRKNHIAATARRLKNPPINTKGVFNFTEIG